MQTSKLTSFDFRSSLCLNTDYFAYFCYLSLVSACQTCKLVLRLFRSTNLSFSVYLMSETNLLAYFYLPALGFCLLINFSRHWLTIEILGACLTNSDHVSTCAQAQLIWSVRRWQKQKKQRGIHVYSHHLWLFYHLILPVQSQQCLVNR